MNRQRPLSDTRQQPLGGWLLAVASVFLAMLAAARFPPARWFVGLEVPTWTPLPEVLHVLGLLAQLALLPALGLVWQQPESPPRRRALSLLLAWLVLLAAWPALSALAGVTALATAALCGIWLLALAVLLAAVRLKPLLAWLVMPAFLWVSFLLVLSGVVVALNPALPP